MKTTIFSFIATIFAFISSIPTLANRVPIDYSVEFEPKKNKVNVEININDATYINRVKFNLEDSLCRHFTSNTELTTNNNELLWQTDAKTASLKYECKINHKRPTRTGKKAYDARITKNWALFRGDDIVPPAHAYFRKGGETEARLTFTLPDGWNGVNTGWDRDLSKSDKLASTEKEQATFLVDNPERRFDRPTGWIIAGELGTRRVKYTQPNESRVAVSAPAQSAFKQMDVLTFLQFTWPAVTEVCNHSPKKLLVVGGEDPMWRGGLSAGNSFYVHADLPIVSENGTSTLLHELFHMCTRIRGEDKADWIAEGLAEFYSLEILRRAGGLTSDRYARSLNAIDRKAQSASTLEVRSSKGATTAKAVLVFVELNKKIKALSDGKQSLDDVVHELMKKRKVNKTDLEQAIQKVTASRSFKLEKYM